MEIDMMDELARLAQQLEGCRRRGNKMSLEHVLESAAILRKARQAAREGFGKWLRDQAHMDRMTAFRHLAVAGFVERHVTLMRHIASLSLAKIYELSTLDPELARRLLTGEERFTRPLDQLSDVQFRREFRERFPRPARRRTRQSAYLEIYSALVRLRKALGRGSPFAGRMSPRQRERIGRELRAVAQAAQGWQVVA
jgi:hypothetical protein